MLGSIVLKFRSMSILLGAAVLFAGCADDRVAEVHETPVTIELVPANVVLEAGLSQVVTAYVIEDGQRIIPKSPAYSVAWSISDTSLVGLSAGGAFARVTGKSGGPVQLDAEVTTKDRKLRRSISVLSRPVISFLRIAGGNGQSGLVLTTLPEQLAVQALNGDGLPIKSVPVQFATRLGNGSIATQQMTTDLNGYALTSWTLGPLAGRNTVEAWTEGSVPVVFEANGVLGVAGVQQNSGNNQIGTPGAALPLPMSVRVLDATLRPLADVEVSWRVLSGNGQVTPTSATDVGGVAFANWTLGTSGAQVVRASVGQMFSDFTATLSGTSTDQLLKVSGDGLTTRVETQFAQPFSVRVVDGQGNPKAGVGITWSILSGGGSVNPASVLTDINGLARTWWTAGATAGAGTLRATSAAGFVTFSTTIEPGGSPPPSGAVASLIITPQSVTLNALGAQSTLTAVAYDANGQPVTGQTINWTSTDSMIARVDNAGHLTARKVGAVLIVATAVCCNKADTAAVTVTQQLASVAVSPRAASVAVGATVQVTATGKDEYGNDAPSALITWLSSNTSIATVTSGSVRGVAAGTAVIHAISGSFRDSSIVTVTTNGSVTPVLTSITLTPAASTLLVGATQSFTASARDQNGNAMSGVNLSWSSSNPSVMTVTQGLVTALAVGAATLTVSSGSVSNSASVTVAPGQSPPPGSYSPPDIAFTDMENGTSGVFTTGDGSNTGDNSISIMSDPTGAFGGTVARIRFARLSTLVTPDINRALNYTHPAGMGFGETIYMRGIVYIPQPAAELTTAMRKLIYVQRQRNDESFAVVKAEGNTLKAEITNNRVFSAGAGSIPYNRKVSLEVQITTNSAAGSSDGVFRVWKDGVEVISATNVLWLTTTAPFKYFLFGQQTQHQLLFDEYRYWDNLAISTKRIGPQ